jgi:hypothetical protein
MESLTQYGPVWALAGLLLAANIKLVFALIKLVENNTAAMQKLTDMVSHCTKNQGINNGNQ